LIRPSFAGVDTSKVVAAKLQIHDLNQAGKTVAGRFSIHRIKNTNLAWVAGTQSGAIGTPSWNELSSGVGWDGGVGLGATGYESALMGVGRIELGLTGQIKDDITGLAGIDLDVAELLLSGSSGFLLKGDDEATNGKYIGGTSTQGSPAGNLPKIEFTHFDIVGADFVRVIIVSALNTAYIRHASQADATTGFPLPINQVIDIPLYRNGVPLLSVFPPTGVDFIYQFFGPK
jgi:hypothetical protein